MYQGNQKGYWWADFALLPHVAPNQGMQATAYSLRLAGLGSGFLMPGVESPLWIDSAVERRLSATRPSQPPYDDDDGL